MEYFINRLAFNRYLTWRRDIGVKLKKRKTEYRRWRKFLSRIPTDNQVLIINWAINNYVIEPPKNLNKLLKRENHELPTKYPSLGPVQRISKRPRLKR